MGVVVAKMCGVHRFPKEYFFCILSGVVVIRRWGFTPTPTRLFKFLDGVVDMVVGVGVVAVVVDGWLGSHPNMTPHIL